MARYVDLDKIIDHLHDEWGYEGMEEELYDDLQIPVENVIAWTPISKELPPIGVPLLVTVDRKIAEGPPPRRCSARSTECRRRWPAK